MKRTKDWRQDVSNSLKKNPKTAAAYMAVLCEADDEDVSLDQ
jgi:hypothetical protein